MGLKIAAFVCFPDSGGFFLSFTDVLLQPNESKKIVLTDLALVSGYLKLENQTHNVWVPRIRNLKNDICWGVKGGAFRKYEKLLF